MSGKGRFLDFPIQLIQGFLVDHDRCLSDVYCYAVYKMVYSEEAIFEDIEGFTNAYESEPSPEFIKSVQTRGEVLYNSFAGTKYVWTGIHISTFMKFFQVDRSEFDLACLLAYIALKSIIQKAKIHRGCSNEYLMSRMAGYQTTMKIEELPGDILKYMKNGSRKKLELFAVLETSYGVVRPEKSRGIAFSLTLSRKELELLIMKKNYLKSQLRVEEEKRLAKEQAKREFEEWRKQRGKE